MRKVILIILFGLIIRSNINAQQKTFGYKLQGNGDILSDVFLIRKGMKLDSLTNKDHGITCKFEYYPDGKLKSDYNYLRAEIRDPVTGRTIGAPAYRNYFYNERGDIDSVGFNYYSNGWKDYGGYKLYNTYDKNGNIINQIYTKGGSANSIEKNSYDSFGNLVQNVDSLIGLGTTYNIWQYDSFNRLTFKKSYVASSNPYWDQYIYKYDSTGNINCLIQGINEASDNPIENKENYYLQFDQEGKLVNQTISDSFDPTDSTWHYKYDIPLIYDNNGRVIQVNLVDYRNHFHYNSDGNVDTLFFPMISELGYLSNRGTLMDAIGNKITPYEIDFGGIFCFYYSGLTTSVEENKKNISNTFNLSQNYPNPFNPVTTINYSIPKQSHVTIKIFDVLGNELTTLINEEKFAGNYSVKFNASAFSSGVYFYKIQAGNFVKTKKMILMK